MQFVRRGDQDKDIRTDRKIKTMSSKRLKAKQEKQALLDDGKTYREVVCERFHFMIHRPNCPMGRASRSPNLERTPWN